MRILAERSSITTEIDSWPAGLLRNVDQYSEIKWLSDLSLESLTCQPSNQGSPCTLSDLSHGVG